MRTVASAALLAAVLLGAARPAAAEEAASETPRATMQRVFDALATLLPASLDPDRFGDPARRDAIQLAFEALATSAEDLARHGERRDAGFAALSRSLADDADLAADRFARGRVEEAAFHVQQLTQRCVGCHSRLPSAREFPMADRLLGRVELRELAPEDRARLYVATRRFDGALGAWEAMFVDPAVPPVALEQGGQLVDYLRRDPRRRRLERSGRRALAARRHAALPAHAPARWADAYRLAQPRLCSSAAPPRGARHPSASSHRPTASSTISRSALHQRCAGLGPGGPDADRARLLGAIEDRTVYSYWLPRRTTWAARARRPAASPAVSSASKILLLDGALPEDLPKTRAALAERALRRP
jgi:hypothetical protein